MVRIACSLCSAAFIVALIGGCGGPSEPPLFELVPPEQTGVDFNNEVIANDTLHIQAYPFLYNGAGVGVGDINNDGLEDLYFAGNITSSRLYLNKGNLQFEDITESAGVGTSVRASGVSMVDINSDGYLDIYVSVGPFGNASRREQANLLFINNGDNTFTEQAEAYNVQGRGYTTHAAFLDYDRDGDLDLYLLNNSPVDFARNEMARVPSVLIDQTTPSYDELYRNDGETFTRVSREAGLLRQTGFGLGVVVDDFNRDGWPDLYISNDILPDDELYINNGDGTFTDRAAEYLKHTSFAGMGVDAADFNNDGWPDILQADMMPESDTQRRKISGANNYEHATGMYAEGYQHQYNLNTLQLNEGTGEQGELLFSEIARLSGVAYTNWSWSALFGDYDNDGLKDIMITNGYAKAVNDFDYIHNLNSAREFGSPEVIDEKEMKILDELYSYHLPNYIYRNNGDLTFTDKTVPWAMDRNSYSYGMVQADLDHDGDLDMVLNNMNEPASIYRNRADTVYSRHYLAVAFDGSSGNLDGIGASVEIVHEGTRQYLYHNPFRGYASSMPPGLHFGLGASASVDTLEVTWPDGRRQILTGLEADRTLTLRYEDADLPERKDPSPAPEQQFFSEITGQSGLDYTHRENEFNDYTKQPLLPHQLSRMGPALAAGDVDGDGLEDLFVGGAAGQAGRLWLQQPGGSFTSDPGEGPWSEDAQFEDLAARFFDADGDGDQDLYVGSGGYEFSPASDLLQDRLYYNTGGGSFVDPRSALPMMLTSTSVVEPADIDADGDLDLFVGGRLVPGQYPVAPRSYILRNDGSSFTDITGEFAPDLVEPGMITDAVWTDLNGDDRPDLVTSGIWMPIRVYENSGGALEDVTDAYGLEEMKGWWYSIHAGDFDGDGDPDFVAGNLGQNYSFPSGEEGTFELYADRFDSNQSFDLMFAVERDGDHYPYFGRAKFQQGIPEIRYLFKTYREYAELEVSDIIGSGGMRDAQHLSADTFASVYIENRGERNLEVRHLPIRAQFSSIEDMVSEDLNGDGHLDLVVAGNLFESEPEIPRNDASNGLVLLGDGSGSFTPIPPYQSGFRAPGNVKNLSLIEGKDGVLITVANNDGPLQLFEILDD